MHTAPELLSEDVLLDLCRISRRYQEVTPESLGDLQAVVRLVGDRWPPRSGRIEHAVALLASVLASHRRVAPTDLALSAGPVAAVARDLGISRRQVYVPPRRATSSCRANSKIPRP